MIIKKGCRFESDFSDGILKITLIGEIDHHSAVPMRSSIDAKIYELRPRELILDLSSIDFMDSSGLGLIMGRYALMGKLGGELSLANPSERAQKIFELAGLSRIIKIKDTKGEENNEK